eukprot:TRINITY_DN4042_c0_g1_i1.p1 TRINITY_DN4042_c0_g1~~TRINITY_DN4042_c0_g1_i1.p1  ORF type:complete len:349 (+),score=65.38 TRINITY_DN4042_c0_g1_i1:954-2000(+)
MKLQIKTIQGKSYDVTVNNDETVASLKNFLSGMVNLPADDQKLVAKGTQVLRNHLLLKECGLSDGDVVALLQTRKQRPQEPVDETAPTKQMIEEITSRTFGVPVRPSSSKKPKSGRAAPTITNLRTQLQDLVGSFMGIPPSAMVAPASNEAEMSAPAAAPAPAPEITIEPALLQQLIDMGFPEDRSRKALILNNMNPQAAMDWILQHEEDPDIDEPISTEELQEIAEFVPDPVAIAKLKDMGFSEEAIKDALKATNNNQEAACAWLLGEHDVAETQTIPMDERTFHLLNSVLTNPVVQSGLSNPRVLQALRVLMEDPNNATQYLNDPEIGPVLMQVHSIMTQNQNRGT